MSIIPDVERFTFTPQLEADGEPYVEIAWGDKTGAMSLDQGRRAALRLLEACEQARLEHDLWTWLEAESGGQPPDAIAAILIQFRRHREQLTAAPFTPGG